MITQKNIKRRLKHHVNEYDKLVAQFRDNIGLSLSIQSEILGYIREKTESLDFEFHELNEIDRDFLIYRSRTKNLCLRFQNLLNELPMVQDQSLEDYVERFLVFVKSFSNLTKEYNRAEDKWKKIQDQILKTLQD